MEKNNAIIERILAARFSRVEVQALKFGRARLVRRDIQYMDVKLMSELMERYRSLARACVKECRTLRTQHAIETDALAKMYLAMDVEAANRKLDGTFALFRIANLDYHTMRRAYLIKCLGPHIAVDWTRVA